MKERGVDVPPGPLYQLYINMLCMVIPIWPMYLKYPKGYLKFVKRNRWECGSCLQGGGRCLEGCLEGLQKVSEKCPEIFWGMFERSWKGVIKVY